MSSNSTEGGLTRRSFLAGLLGGVLVLAVGLLASRMDLSSLQGMSHRIRIPQCVMNEDFQRPLDRDLTDVVQDIERTEVCRFVNAEILDPLVDDVQSLKFSIEGLQVTKGQFPDRPEIQKVIDDCARILRVPRPRVYVANLPGVRVFSTNFREPIIILSSSVLSRYTNTAELRFLIGREMGHIRCSHVQWLMVLRYAHRSLPQGIGVVTLLPLLKWGREAEMSADNAGLICCQDLKAAELSLLRGLLNVNEQSVGQIDVDSYLRQRANIDASTFSEAVLLWRQWSREQPFAVDRIQQLRKYAESWQYRHLWEG